MLLRITTSRVFHGPVDGYGYGWRLRRYLLLVSPAQAQTSSGDGLNGYVSQLVQGLNLITAFGFIVGCTMVIGCFLNARKDSI
jgi:hypothetical protein